MTSSIQFACGVLAIVIPLLLAAGFYAQLLLDQLGDGRDLFVVAVSSTGGIVGEAAALVGVFDPNRWWAALAALGCAMSAAGLVLVPTLSLRLRARRRSPGATSRPGTRPVGQTRTAPPQGGADREGFTTRR